MRAALAAALLLLSLPAVAAAAPELVRVGEFEAPVHVAAPPGDGARLFVVEQGGRVRVLVDGQVAAAPFLDVADITAAGGERGLLSIAFAPDYAASGLFYVFLTATAGELVILEGRRSAGEPNRADPAYRRVVLSIPHPRTNHNGGQLAFGPDGLLYVGTGDGGGQGDPDDNAQNPASLLGKILRLDPRVAGSQHVYALGLRNPWRFSFDRATGDLAIGDVGGSVNEEIDVAPAGAGPGRNYGWDVCEGDVPSPCPVAGAIPPVLSLPRSAGYSGVIGGFVVRDPGLPTLQGRYVFADLAKPALMSAAFGAGGPRIESTLPIGAPSSFGEDACGHVYVASLNGPVFRLQDGPVSTCAAASPPATPGSGSAAARDARAPTLRVRYRGTQRLRRLRVVLRANEDCAVSVRARRFRTRKLALAAGVRKVVRLKATRKGARRLRRALARRGRLNVTIRIAARDAAGNVNVRRVRPGVRR